MRREGVRQLVKFCLVGASSMVLDLSLQALLLTLFPAMPWWLAKTISFGLAVTNGFFWNSRWTFKKVNAVSQRKQYTKFLLTNLVGWGLNLSISKIFLMMITGKIIHSENPPTIYVLCASVFATIFVVIWNFSAAKYWTFKAPKTDAVAPVSPEPKGV